MVFLNRPFHCKYLKAICLPKTLLSPIFNILSFMSLNGSATNFEQVLNFLKASFFDYSLRLHYTKNKVSIKIFFSKCDKVCSFLRIWSHLLKKSLMEKQCYYKFIIGCISQSSTCFKSCFDINSRYTK